MTPVVVLLAALACDAPPPAETPTVLGTIAVLPVTGQDVGFDELVWLQQIVREEVVRLGVDVQTDEETIGHLTSARQLGVSCGRATTECMAQVGAIAGVGKVVAAGARGHGDGTVLDLRLVDVQSAAEERRVVRLLNGPDDDRRARVLDAATRLLFPARARGELVVVTIEGAEVLVDGVFRGYAPLPAAIDLAAGEHVLDVRAAGHEPRSVTIVAQAGETMTFTERLVPRPKSVSTQNERATRVEPYGLVGGIAATVLGSALMCAGTLPLLVCGVTRISLEESGRIYARAENSTDPKEQEDAARQLKQVQRSPEAVALMRQGHAGSTLLLAPGIVAMVLGSAGALAGATWTARSAFAPAEEE